MTRLIRAEWYRLTHWKVSARWMWIVCICGFLFAVLGDENAFAMKMQEYLNQADGLSLIFFGVFPVYISVMLALEYNNKIAYYELMAGYKISQMLWSKILVYACSMTALTCLIFTGLCVVIGMMNGTGGMNFIFLRLLLAVFNVLRINIVCVLISITFHHLVSAVAVFIYYSLFQPLLVFFLQFINQEWSDILIDSFSERQFLIACNSGGEIYMRNPQVLLLVVSSFILEIGFWYLLSYISIKKRWNF